MNIFNSCSEICKTLTHYLNSVAKLWNKKVKKNLVILRWCIVINRYWLYYHSQILSCYFSSTSVFHFSLPCFDSTLTWTCVDRPQRRYSNCRRSGTRSIPLVCISAASSSLGTPLSLPASSKREPACVCVCVWVHHLKQVHCTGRVKQFFPSLTFSASVCWAGKHFYKSCLEKRKCGYCTENTSESRASASPSLSTTD